MLKRNLVVAAAAVFAVTSLAGCSSKKATATSDSWSTIEKQAKKEGKVASVGMPDTWANWIGTWSDIKSKYSIAHTDTDMSSAQELQKFKQAKSSDSPDIGDIGLNVAPTAVEQNLVTPYKTKYWKEIPSWAKDKKGYYSAGYSGSIVFITDTKNVKAADAPKSWADLAKGDYKVSIGDVASAAQAQYSVLAASYANGGSENDLKPGLDYFAKLGAKKRLSTVEPNIQNMQKGELKVAVMWDFNALNYAHHIDSKRFKITVPTDGTVTSGYTEIINKNAAHPYAAKLARNFILSDQGQINLAKGYARPIRSSVKLPADVEKKLIPQSEYKKVFHVKSNEVWNKATVKLGQQWQDKVLGSK
ncbi:ABC transporter, solute-binding protein [Levilactobacillus senmaizukei DSM 21775 = NBRC 103853]|uniref:ABC transporter, solute-binding protein n=1 Tax=Levilactobacillus senmaizukei DSM 21775 = NBRC 103853 TaxID=1423803 RepID=A0A0R2DQX9_9LACO|nr:ABC transporter substrate-binding protein [Levilactobacillus senmaizukei]KRN03239.1 ABC transporter, solute-binding protein [Levilactobacillus senmaizukei DSM 21775 = NBRC 103853]